jgi:predicted nucleic acid-binding protein
MLYLDTSVLVRLFLPEADSDRLQRWIERQDSGGMCISEWTLTEFASALGLKVRSKQLEPEQALDARRLLGTLSAESFLVLTPTRADYVRAAAFLDEHELGLRAGDALHLAIALNEGIDTVYSLDRVFLAAARKLKIKTARPL